MRIACSPLLLFSLLLPRIAGAQYATPYGPVQGARVRVTMSDTTIDPLAGQLVAFAADSLVVDVASGRARLRLPLRTLRRVDVSEGRDRTASALRYAVGGTLVGAVAGPIVLRADGGLERMISALVVGAMGLVTGGAVGAFAAPERWRNAWTARP